MPVGGLWLINGAYAIGCEGGRQMSGHPTNLVKRLIERESTSGCASKAAAVPTSLDFLTQLYFFNSLSPKVHQHYDHNISETQLYPIEVSPLFVSYLYE